MAAALGVPWIAPWLGLRSRTRKLSPIFAALVVDDRDSETGPRLAGGEGQGAASRREVLTAVVLALVVLVAQARCVDHCRHCLEPYAEAAVPGPVVVRPPVADRTGPVVRLVKPMKASRRSSWRHVAGTVSDNGCGPRDVVVKAWSRSGKQWFTYRSGRWTKVAAPVRPRPEPAGSPAGPCRPDGGRCPCGLRGSAGSTCGTWPPTRQATPRSRLGPRGPVPFMSG